MYNYVTLQQATKIFHDKGVKHVVLLPGYDDLVMLVSEKGTYAHRQSDTTCVHTTHRYMYKHSWMDIGQTRTHICMY